MNKSNDYLVSPTNRVVHGFDIENPSDQANFTAHNQTLSCKYDLEYSPYTFEFLSKFKFFEFVTPN